MADTDEKNSKQLLIEAIRQTPEGIADFLEAKIPMPPTIATPGDVDGAIIANGIASKYICDLFRPFAELTPIELMLRIGQHNSVLEIATLAGLEYFKGDGDESDPDDLALKILEPKDGGTYLPGTLRIRAKGMNGDLVQCEFKMPDNSPIAMDDIGNGIFEGDLTLVDEQTYTLSVQGFFQTDDNLQITEVVTFTISSDPEEEPDPPGGVDNPAIDRVEGIISAAIRKMLGANSISAYVKALFAVVKANYTILYEIAKKIFRGKLSQALLIYFDEAESVLELIDQALDDDDDDAVDRELGRLQSIIAHIIRIVRG